MDLFLEVFPAVVVEGWSQGRNDHGRRGLEGYLGILNAGTAYGEEGGTSVAPRFYTDSQPFTQTLVL